MIARRVAGSLWSVLFSTGVCHDNGTDDACDVPGGSGSGRDEDPANARQSEGRLRQDDHLKRPDRRRSAGSRSRVEDRIQGDGSGKLAEKEVQRMEKGKVVIGEEDIGAEVTPTGVGMIEVEATVTPPAGKVTTKKYKIEVK